ncbi:MAG: nuclear transport factor 2 family protein [Bradyrhizobium sp.]|nr:nuclear transport factor 2 family protein [Bradyrhizobium sp.]
MHIPTFAELWIDDWNSHDLERILKRYSENVVINSPYAKIYSSGGQLRGKVDLRKYWKEALWRRPKLRFELIEVFAGHNAATIVYCEETSKRIAETFVFDEDELIAVTSACLSVKV